MKPGTIRWGWWSFSEAFDLWLGIMMCSNYSSSSKQFLEEEFWKELSSGQLLDGNYDEM